MSPPPWFSFSHLLFFFLLVSVVSFFLGDWVGVFVLVCRCFLCFETWVLYVFLAVLCFCSFLPFCVLGFCLYYAFFGVFWCFCFHLLFLLVFFFVFMCLFSLYRIFVMDLFLFCSCFVFVFAFLPFFFPFLLDYRSVSFSFPLVFPAGVCGSWS